MLAALQTVVKGGKCYGLIDKASFLETLRLGWTQVECNAGILAILRIGKAVAGRTGRASCRRGDRGAAVKRAMGADLVQWNEVRACDTAFEPTEGADQ